MFLVAKIILILAIFFGVLAALGSGFGTLEIIIWMTLMIAALIVTIKRHRDSRNSNS